jgi:putative sterol carrier protein
VRVVPGAADEPDVVLSTDLETAIALARGDITAQSVLASGRLHVSGELDSLARHSAALAAVDDVFETVRRDTTFPPADAR